MRCEPDCGIHCDESCDKVEVLHITKPDAFLYFAYKEGVLNYGVAVNADVGLWKRICNAFSHIFSKGNIRIIAPAAHLSDDAQLIRDMSNYLLDVAKDMDYHYDLNSQENNNG